MFFIVSDSEHFLMLLLAILNPSFRKCLSCPLSIKWIVCFAVVEFISYSEILDVNPLSDEPFPNIFSHSVSCVFTLLTVSSAVQKLFTTVIPFLHFLFNYLCYGVFPISLCLHPSLVEFSDVFLWQFDGTRSCS